MVEFTRVWNWYSRESVQRALIEAARDREVAPVFKDGRFGKRPNTINYQGDVVQLVAEGTVSFHSSVEKWHQPMKLDVGMGKEQLDSLRKGWDILIDPDVPDFEIGKAVTAQVIEALKDHGVINYSLKFSGGKGFHIGVPFESMPDQINMKPTSGFYPETFAKIINYLKFYMKEQLKEAILELDTPVNIAKRVGKQMSDVIDSEGLDPYKIVSMDIFSSRHLFRMPYSLHEKTLLVSLPMNYAKLKSFEKEMALPEKAKVEDKFLQQRVPSHDAEAFVIEALDWASKQKAEAPVAEKPKDFKPQRMVYIGEENFPPCVKHMLQVGLGDGRKRAVFILINFLRNMGWNPEQVEKRIFEWNEKNRPPIGANYLRSQLRWHFRQEKPMLPPNCENDNFYKAIGVYQLCELVHKQGIKNPVNYPIRQMRKADKSKR
jgi:DNA primase large subunit